MLPKKADGSFVSSRETIKKNREQIYFMLPKKADGSFVSSRETIKKNREQIYHRQT